MVKHRLGGEPSHLGLVINTADQDSSDVRGGLDALAHAKTLIAQFIRTSSSDSLYGAIAAYRYAVTTIPRPHPDHATALNNLSAALQCLYDHNHDLAALIEAIALGQRAVAATPIDHPHHAGRRRNLSNAQKRQSRHTAEPEFDS